MVGGAEKLLLNALPIYKKYGVDVEVLVFKRTNSFLEKELINLNIKVSYLGDKGSLYNPFIIYKIIPYLRGKDIVHVHLFPASYWVAIARIFCISKAKFFFTEHSTFNKRRKKYLFKILESFIYCFYHKIVCITVATKENLLDHLVFRNREKFVVINNGIDISSFAKAVLVDYKFFDENDFILTQVSSFRREKDHVTLLNAMVLLPDNVKLLLIGDGVLRIELTELTHKLGIQDRVIFLGVRNDIPELIKYSNVVILSSNYEGFGLAALEGMASKKPTVASDIKGVREVVGGYGLMFKKGDGESLANCINMLYSDSMFYEEVAMRCFHRSKEFDIRIMVKKYILEYKTLL